MEQQIKYWTSFSGLPNLLYPREYALIIDGKIMQEEMLKKSGSGRYRMDSIIETIEEIFGCKFLIREWHQSTKNGKPTAFHYAISLAKNGKITPIINKQVTVNGIFLHNSDKSDTTISSGTVIEIQQNKLSDLSIIMGLQEKLRYCEKVLFISDSFDVISLLKSNSFIDFNKLKICVPRRDTLAMSVDKSTHILRDTNGTPIYLDDILASQDHSIQTYSSSCVTVTSDSSTYTTPKSYADILITDPTLSNHFVPKKRITSSTVGQPKCMLGRECRSNDHIHNAEYRHPCPYYTGCKFLIDSDQGTAQERYEHFTMYGHPCLFSKKCKRPTHQPHWTTHEHVIDSSRILSHCSNSDCPSLRGNDRISIQHREHFSHPCKYGKDCPSKQDMVWNHDHRFYFTH